MRSDPNYVPRALVLHGDQRSRAGSEIIHFVWALLILGYKALLVRRERQLLDRELIHVPEGIKVLPEDAKDYARQLEDLPPEDKPMLVVRALQRTLDRFAATRSIRDAAETSRAVCDSEADRLDSGLAMIRYIAWAIPAIGFIGTVRHIGEALLQAHKAVTGDITDVTSEPRYRVQRHVRRTVADDRVDVLPAPAAADAGAVRARHRSLDRSAPDPAHAGEIDLLALELIDSGLLLARRRGEDSEVLTEAPGFAVLDDEKTLTGSDAAGRVRLKPLLAHTNFWRALSTEPLTRPSRLVRTTADVAFAQAEAILGPYKAEGESVLLAVPAGYSREQLGVAAGRGQRDRRPRRGLVDAALAACSLEPAPARVLHLDLELHQAILTVLEYTGGDRSGLKRSRYEIALRHGVLAIQQTLMQFIAETFIRKTRFDPLHDASSEQRLVDQLPRVAQPVAQQRTDRRHHAVR